MGQYRTGNPKTGNSLSSNQKKVSLALIPEIIARATELVTMQLQVFPGAMGQVRGRGPTPGGGGEGGTP